MRSLLPYPRFSECIQAVAYCLMYDTDGCDIIQGKTLFSHRNHLSAYQPMKSFHTTFATTLFQVRQQMRKKTCQIVTPKHFQLMTKTHQPKSIENGKLTRKEKRKRILPMV